MIRQFSSAFSYFRRVDSQDATSAPRSSRRIYSTIPGDWSRPPQMDRLDHGKTSSESPIRHLIAPRPLLVWRSG